MGTIDCLQVCQLIVIQRAPRAPQQGLGPELDDYWLLLGLLGINVEEQKAVTIEPLVAMTIMTQELAQVL